jgi:hypothetical protein
MGLILWPAALLLFLFWSLAAWIVFGLSDWLASLVAGAAGGLLATEIGPWASWIINSLGTIVKFGVVALWAVVGLGILAAPLWLRRQRIAGRIPESYSQNYRYRNEPRDVRFSERRDASDDFKDMSHKRGDRDNSWRDREAWQQRAGQGYGEAAFLRDAVRDMMGKYRGKKKRKRDRDDDDD